MIAAPTPAERLARSREFMRRALDQAVAGDKPTSSRSAQSALQWWNEVKALPGAGVLIDAAQGWWARHPLRTTAVLLAHAALAAARPIARRHPLSAVLAAFLFGGLLVWSRPWRWALKPALLAGLLPQILSAWLTPAPREPIPPAPH